MTYRNGYQRRLDREAFQRAGRPVLTADQALAAAVDRLTMPVIVDGRIERRGIAGVDAGTGRSKPVLKPGERVDYHIDGTTHVVAEITA